MSEIKLNVKRVTNRGEAQNEESLYSFVNSEASDWGGWGNKTQVDGLQETISRLTTFLVTKGVMSKDELKEVLNYRGDFDLIEDTDNLKMT